MGLGVWYTSPYGYDPIHFGYAMGSFTTHSTGSLAAAAPSLERGRLLGWAAGSAVGSAAAASVVVAAGPGSRRRRANHRSGLWQADADD